MSACDNHNGIVADGKIWLTDGKRLGNVKLWVIYGDSRKGDVWSFSRE